MIFIKNKIQLENELGKNYSLFEILKLKGIGSPRIIYLNPNFGITNKTTILDNRLFSNLKLFPLGIEIISTQQNIAIKNNDLKQIEFIERPIEVKTRFGIRIVHDAKISFTTNSNHKLEFYCPKQSFKSLKIYFQKTYFENKVKFLVNTNSQKDSNPLVIEYILDIIKPF